MLRRQWLLSTAALLAGPALLKKHVVLLRGGQASQVRYAGFAADRVELKRYLETLSAQLLRVATPFCLRARAVTSGRCWETHGWI